MTGGRAGRAVRWLCGASACAWFVLGACFAVAHPLDYTRLSVDLQADGRWSAEVRADLTTVLQSPDAYHRMAQAAQREDPARTAMIADLLAGLRFRFDGEPAPAAVASIEFPDLDAAGFADYWARKLTLLRIEGAVPAGASAFTLAVADRLPIRYPLVLTVTREVDGASRTRWLDHGIVSQSFSLAPGPRASSGGGTDDTRLAGGDALGAVVAHYVVQGFLHILPLGADHVLFVLGLFLFGTGWRPLLIQVTGFTLAHSLTLGLALHGLISLPDRWVESLIGLSILWIAIENVVGLDSGRWRFVVVFAFGLLHGLGFAGALRELEVAADEFAPALIGFNVGVEAGQLVILLLAFAAFGRLRGRADYRRRVVIPGSLLIGAAGAWWTLERALLLG